MYFAVIGDKHFAIRELALVQPTNISWSGESLVMFDTARPDLLQQCAQVIKRGKLVESHGDASVLEELVQSACANGRNILGTQTKELGMKLKRELAGIRRFKQTDLLHTDEEVRDKGIEVIKVSSYYGFVQGYQNISLYETIDFGKPVRGMQIGMMPAKLVRFLINLGVIEGDSKNKRKQEKSGEQKSQPTNFTIWDPFVGFGTTSFMANAMGYNAIGSDMNITSAKKNLPRRKESLNTQNSKTTTLPKLSFFKHDVTEPFTQKMLYATDLIVTEGRLGPILPHLHMPLPQLDKNQDMIRAVYKSFLDNIYAFFGAEIEKNNKGQGEAREGIPPLVMTIPRYVQTAQSNAKHIADRCVMHGFICEVLPDVYSRKGQTVARQIVLIK